MEVVFANLNTMLFALQNLVQATAAAADAAAATEEATVVYMDSRVGKDAGQDQQDEAISNQPR